MGAILAASIAGFLVQRRAGRPHQAGRGGSDGGTVDHHTWVVIDPIPRETARFTLDDGPPHSYPINLQNVPPGVHKARLEAGELYGTWETTFTLAEGEGKNLNRVELPLLKAKLHITMNVPKAGHASLFTKRHRNLRDGTLEPSTRPDRDLGDVGATPVTFDVPPDDTWSLRVTAPGYEDYEEHVYGSRIEATFNVTMQKSLSPGDGSDGSLSKGAVEASLKKYRGSLVACARDFSGSVTMRVSVDAQGSVSARERSGMYSVHENTGFGNLAATDCFSALWSTMRFPKAKAPTEFILSLSSNYGAGFSAAALFD